MKKNAIFLSVMATALLLTACKGGSTESRLDQTAVTDADETAGGAEGRDGDTVKAETEADAAAAKPENPALAEESAEQAQSDQDADTEREDESEQDESEA